MKQRCARTHSHQRQELSALTSRLRGLSRKVTGPRAAILEVLRQYPHPLTIREILDGLPPGQCNLATVYRSMHLLEQTWPGTPDPWRRKNFAPP